MGTIRVGTSGWNYPHWRGAFYPEGLAQKEWFGFYRERFDTVEVNNTFYQLPAPETVEAWRRQAGDDFRYTVKASRYITHMKKLKDPEEATAQLFDRLRLLGPACDLVLFQLPPKWTRNRSRLEAFVRSLPAGWRYAFEFRDPSWFHEEIYQVLGQANAAFCMYELDTLRSPEKLTSDLVYLRLHGPEGRYQGSYSDNALTEWAQRCRGWADGGRDVRIYFDNDERGFAARNALTLRRLLNRNR